MVESRLSSVSCERDRITISYERMEDVVDRTALLSRSESFTAIDH